MGVRTLRLAPSVGGREVEYETVVLHRRAFSFILCQKESWAEGMGLGRAAATCRPTSARAEGTATRAADKRAGRRRGWVPLGCRCRLWLLLHALQIRVTKCGNTALGYLNVANSERKALELVCYWA